MAVASYLIYLDTYIASVHFDGHIYSSGVFAFMSLNSGVEIGLGPVSIWQNEDITGSSRGEISAGVKLSHFHGWHHLFHPATICQNYSVGHALRTSGNFQKRLVTEMD